MFWKTIWNKWAFWLAIEPEGRAWWNEYTFLRVSLEELPIKVCSGRKWLPSLKVCKKISSMGDLLNISTNKPTLRSEVTHSPLAAWTLTTVEHRIMIMTSVKLSNTILILKTTWNNDIYWSILRTTELLELTVGFPITPEGSTDTISYLTDGETKPELVPRCFP